MGVEFREVGLRPQPTDTSPPPVDRGPRRLYRPTEYRILKLGATAMISSKCAAQGASLVEFALLIALIALLTIVSLEELAWKVGCSTTVSAMELSLTEDHTGLYTQLGTQCTWFYQDMTTFHSRMDFMRNEVCAKSVHSVIVESLRQSCNF